VTTPPTPAARAAAEKIAGPHYECEDCWYSCPLSSGGCCNENEAKDICTCGRDARVEAILAHDAQTRRVALEAVKSVVKVDDAHDRVHDDWTAGYAKALEDIAAEIDRLAREGER
jgi:hypothetical protein